MHQVQRVGNRVQRYVAPTSLDDASSVLRRSTVSLAVEATTLTRFYNDLNAIADRRVQPT